MTMSSKAKQSGFWAFVLVAGFVWIVFDNLALGIIFGAIAGGTAATRAQARIEQGGDGR